MIKNQKSKIKNQKVIHWLILFLILSLSAFLRIYKIDGYMTFLGDEGRDALVVYNILHGKLTFLGPTASVGGFFMGPVYYYFMAPFLWLFNYNPAGPAVMVALFGTATVWLIYKVGSEFFNKKAGFFAAMLYAVSPLAIAYSRSSWNPNLMPFFTLLTIYLLYKAVKLDKFKLFVIAGIMYGILIQLHYVELFFGAAIILYILLMRGFSKERYPHKIILGLFKDYSAIFIGFIIGFSPFLSFEVRHRFPNTITIINFIFNSPDTGINNNFWGNISNVFFRLFGRLLTNFPPPEQVSLGQNPNITIWYYLTLLLGILSVGLLLFKAFSSLKQRKDDFLKYSILIVWFFVGILFFGFYKKSIYDYYFQFMFPLPFLLVGLLLSALYAISFKFMQIKILGKILAVGIFGILFWININAMPFKNPPNRQMEQVKQIAEFVLGKTGNKPFNFALITGGNSDHGYKYFMKLAKNYPVTIEIEQNDPKRNTVTDQLLVVCEIPDCKPIGHPLWEIAGFGQAEIVGEWNISVVKVYKLKHYRKK